MGFQFRSGLAGLFALTAQAALELAAAQDAQLPRLYTNEIAIEDATRRTALGIDDPVAVFAFIFGALPDRVRVYPTENYFYFSSSTTGPAMQAISGSQQSPAIAENFTSNIIRTSSNGWAKPGPITRFSTLRGVWRSSGSSGWSIACRVNRRASC